MSVVLVDRIAGEEGGGGAAIDITYDNSDSGLSATDVQEAIDELASSGSGANTTLSNLSSPTAINQDLLDDGNGRFLGDSDFPFARLTLSDGIYNRFLSSSPVLDIGNNILRSSFNAVSLNYHTRVLYDTSVGASVKYSDRQLTNAAEDPIIEWSNDEARIYKTMIAESAVKFSAFRIVQNTDSPVNMSNTTDHTVLADTSTGAITINLPDNPSDGHEVYVGDAVNSAASNNITVNVGGMGHLVNSPAGQVSSFSVVTDAKVYKLKYKSGVWYPIGECF